MHSTERHPLSCLDCSTFLSDPNQQVPPTISPDNNRQIQFPKHCPQFRYRAVLGICVVFFLSHYLKNGRGRRHLTVAHKTEHIYRVAQMFLYSP